MTVLTSVEREGQRYVDDPVFVEVSRANRLSLRVNGALRSMAHCYSFGAVRQVRQIAPYIAPVIESFSHYRRVPLRWMKPDGCGGLVPKTRRELSANKHTREAR